MKFVITSGRSESVLFTIETDSIRSAVEAAVKAGTTLRKADLSGADLSGTGLTSAHENE